jgi:anthranilate synthase component I
VLADDLTPVAAFRRIDDGRYAFLLESLGGGEHWGRYSLLGSRPALVFVARGRHCEIRCGDDVRPCSGTPADELRALLARHRAVALPGLPSCCGAAVGYLGRDAVRWFEPGAAAPAGGPALPDAVFLFSDVVSVFDHAAQVFQVVTHARGGDDPDAAYAAAAARLEAELERLRSPGASLATAVPAVGPAATEMPRESFLAAAGRARDLVRAGELLQAAIALPASAPVTRPPLETYRALRIACPSPGLYLLRMGETALAGSAPGALLRRTGDLLEARPLSGARPRGRDAEEDARRGEALRADEAECATHALLVDLARSDVGLVSQPGTVEARDFLTVERGAHTLRLATTVRGRARAGLEPLDALRACFPAGGLAGVPRLRAMESGDAPAGFLAGAVGHFDYRGDFELCPTARAVAFADGRAFWGGVTTVAADTEPEAAWLQAGDEARRVGQVVLAAERGLP